MNDTSPRDWSQVRRFGDRPGSVACVVRPSAYGFVVDHQGRLVVVRSDEGVFLPGGGLEGDEVPEAAVRRETLEECGFLVRVGVCVSQAIQFVYLAATGVCIEKRCSFFTTQMVGQAAQTAPPEHEVLWLSADVVVDALSLESHRWAVRDWLTRI